MSDDLIAEMSSCLHTYNLMSDPNAIDMTKSNLYDVLIECVTRHFPTSYLEIGVQEGRSLSTVLRADTGKLINRIALCDNWGEDFGGTNRGNNNHIHNVLRSVNYQGEVDFYDGDSKETIPTIKEKYSMILVDGDHSAEGCLVDIETSWEVLEDLGIMLIDDIVHPLHKYLLDVVSYFIGFNSESIQSVDYRIDQPNGVIVIKKKGANRE